MLHLPFLYIAPSPLGGRGVFATEMIPAGGIIESAPVIVLSATDRATIHATHLHDYYFEWDGAGAAIALGLGSIYNHSDDPGVTYEPDYAFSRIRFTALRDIPAGQELLINYRAGARGMALWF